ncbi:aminotransferase class I/II-fold pyridoxal phosphate-dependent enzyme [Cellulomonas rhizosphaerae]|uniref:Aminotransferase n=2 Tax=Cellulomonas rhizosphaerae TaxID=2293719 RepID=A0A413RH84_9CELL|nr:aminotransferase class I/II-fold pyridoxal phosphate-dependent enzyme [Cellulomonas rhizosphaerae]
MDVPQAEPVIRAVTDAMVAGDTGYDTPTAYAEAFAPFALERFGWTVDVAAARTVPDVMTGIVEVIRLCTDPGDAVVINPPVYPPFTQFLEHADRRVVPVPLRGARLDLAALEEAFATATAGGRRAAYLLCHPHNPTGTVHTVDELRAVGELARAAGVAVVADEVHAPLVLDGTFVPAATVIPEAIALHSASKAFNLAALRAAVAVPGTAAVDRLARMSDVVADGVMHLATLAHAAAYRECGAWLDTLLEDLRTNRSLLQRLLAEQVTSARWEPGSGTYFAWIDLRQLGDDPAGTLLREARLAVNPGTTFGPEGAGFVRLNFAASTATITEAVRRMSGVLHG